MSKCSFDDHMLIRGWILVKYWERLFPAYSELPIRPRVRPAPMRRRPNRLRFTNYSRNILR
jgi:hypothetical protein